ncbi:MAG: hypothetical protein N2C12_07545 [Planctomycetales bacterium]
MKYPPLRTSLATALLGVGLVPQLTASAGEPGVVRISDGVQQTSANVRETAPPAPPSPLPSDLVGDVNGSTNPVSTPSTHSKYVVRPHQQCQQCQGDSGHSCRFCKNRKPLDNGFYPPSADPRVYNNPVVYQRYLPNQFYGTPGMRYSEVQYPMIHTPTDTTQLGFNYQHVPQWQPNRANYPLAPNPVMWQRRVNPQYPCNDQPVQGQLRHFGAERHDILPQPDYRFQATRPADSQI